MQELPSSQTVDPLRDQGNPKDPSAAEVQQTSPASERTKAPELHVHFLRMNNQELVDYLHHYCPEISEAIWTQLHILDEPAIELQLRDPELQHDQREGAVTHLHYELEMVKLVLTFQEFIEQFVFQDDRTPISFGQFELLPQEVIPRLVFMIMLSDVGKAGFTQLQPGEMPPILQIYTHVVMDPVRHGSWLKTHVHDQLPVELQDAVTYVNNQEDLHKQVFGAGNFGMAPMRLALYCAEQVFMESFPESTQFRSYFQVSEAMIQDLAAIGMDVDRTLMKDFWTAAHLLSGEKFFAGDAVADADKKVALLSLLHHYSQGVLPHGASGLDLNDPRAIKLIALTELLDKADANCHRSKIHDVDALVRITENMVLPGILHLNNQEEALTEVVIYRETFDFLKKTAVFEALLATHDHQQD